MNGFRRQTGIGLIEIMLSMLIASFLMLGIIGIFTGNKRTYNYQQVQSMSNDTQRMGSILFTNILHQTGYVPMTAEGIAGKHRVFQTSDTTTLADFGSGESIVGAQADLADGRANDSLTIRYIAGSGIITCTGEPFESEYVSGSTTELVYKLRTERLFVDAQGHLICSAISQIDEATATESVVLLGDVLTENFQQIRVLSMRLTYGVDLDGDDSVDIYGRASEIDALDFDGEVNEDLSPVTGWHRVRSVAVQLETQTGMQRTPQTIEYVIHLENLSAITV